ncbi:MAG: AmmeMemoRadiSam system protein B [Phycisphaerae bacterium]|nr:AmmeMemoRadiSam system protein B [Phycisphaerae bacterium]
MMIREPAVAGMFYARDGDECRAELRRCLQRAEEKAAGRDAGADLRNIVGGIVPHAGWICSGAVAAGVFNEIARRQEPGVVVIFGAVHVRHGPRASVFPSGAWETPLGLADVDGRLAERLLGQTGLLDADPHAHEREHSIEVLVPFVQHLLPASRIVPIMVPANDNAATLGTAIGRTCKAYGVEAIFVGSTDLTHYGPSYGFAPKGVGAAGLAWAKDVNDRRMVDLILSLRADDAVGEASASQNACGAGAIAATIAACKACGATRATLLEHTTSYEVLSELVKEPMYDAVGYAGIVFD